MATCNCTVKKCCFYSIMQNLNILLSILFNPQREEAMKLVRDAIAAGIFNDLGSGSNVDLCIITKDKVDFLRPYDEANQKGER